MKHMLIKQLEERENTNQDFKMYWQSSKYNTSNLWDTTKAI